MAHRECITPAGMRKLQDEVQWLWTVERPRVTQEVSDAAAMGDRSENAEYIYGKRRLREIDRRLQFLSKRIQKLDVIDPLLVADQGRIAFGARVTLEDEDGAEVEYQLVGVDESDVKEGKISVDSPVGRALLGKVVDDEVEVHVPRGSVIYTVMAIRYE